VTDYDSCLPAAYCYARDDAVYDNATTLADFDSQFTYSVGTSWLSGQVESNGVNTTLDNVRASLILCAAFIK